jgi:hypothetical protein
MTPGPTWTRAAGSGAITGATPPATAHGLSGSQWRPGLSSADCPRRPGVAPATLELPQISDLPGLADLPAMLDLPRLLGEPDMLDVPGIPDAPGVLGLLDLPGISSRPGIPDVPGAIDLPGIPEVPGAIDLPATVPPIVRTGPPGGPITPPTGLTR